MASIALGAIVGCILAAILVALQGCGGPQPASAPSSLQVIEDCVPCMGRCIADVAKRIEANKHADAGSE